MIHLNKNLPSNHNAVFKLTAETIFVSTTWLNGTKIYAFDVKIFKRDNCQIIVFYVIINTINAH